MITPLPFGGMVLLSVIEGGFHISAIQMMNPSRKKRESGGNLTGFWQGILLQMRRVSTTARHCTLSTGTLEIDQTLSLPPRKSEPRRADRQAEGCQHSW